MAPDPRSSAGRHWIRRWVPGVVSVGTVLVLAVAAYRARPGDPWLPNRIPEPAPYNVAEAHQHPPPYESHWEGELNPATCATCHSRIFEEWNGSMMSNSWRDPVWRAAFLLSARTLATDGDCDVPEPPDGTERARLNPFDVGGCKSRFDLGTGEHTTSRSGSLLDGFCSRCHMPTNYVDNVPLRNVQEARGRDVADVHPAFDPTDSAGTDLAFATVEERYRNTPTGERGIFCGVCHTMAESRNTPYHNFPHRGREYTPAPGPEPRSAQVPPEQRRSPWAPASQAPHLGYGIGAGSFRLSPHAIATGTVFGPLTAPDSPLAGTPDRYLTETLGRESVHEAVAAEAVNHEGYFHSRFQRSEMCATCHDVTNPLTLRNREGRWVGGFPIERTYTEWLTSRYADRPGNESFDPRFKRDCQTCHMQQDRGRAGTAQTEYEDGRPVAPLTGSPADDGPEREPYYSHHFIGGNAYVPALIGADVDAMGQVEPYPELSVYSYSSADPKSQYYNAYWVGAEEASGRPTHHALLAWDRLRHALELELAAPERVTPGQDAALRIAVGNTGCGHNFPSGFPEGRVAWVAVRARDLGTGEELEIHDSHWGRTSRGVGGLTTDDGVDPNYPDRCGWKVPAGSPDPFSYQMKAVASKGDGCPTLDLVLATALNLETDGAGRPVDADGEVIDGSNPDGLPVFRDLDGDGDLYDDAFLMDTRLRPLPHEAATVDLDRYSVVVPQDAVGPVAVTAAVYYQSLEAVVAKKFLGNLADTDMDHVLEPCVLGGACDGRTPSGEPPVVEGAPPVPMEVVTRVVGLEGRTDDARPAVVGRSPAPGSGGPGRGVVVRVRLSEPVQGLDAGSFRLADASGKPVPASVEQVGETTWGLFPDAVDLEPGQRYTARLEPVCDWGGNCLPGPVEWSFRVAREE